MDPEFWLSLAGLLLLIIGGLIALVYRLLDREILKLRKWRHEKADPYIGAMDALKQQVDRHERKLFNGKRE